MLSSEENEATVEMEQADADARIQYAISLLNPFLMKFILSNPVMSKTKRNKMTDFSQSLQAIIDDWSMLYPPESKFVNFKKYFIRAKKIRNLVAHQSFDCNKYQHDMECLAMVATAIEKSNLAKIILNSVLIKEDAKEKQPESFVEEENSLVNVDKLKKDEWTSLKQEGNQFYKQERWTEAMNCYTRAIHINQEEPVLYSNRALCELRLSKFDLAREDIEDAIQLDPKNIKYYRILSDILLQMKMHQESLAACLQGLNIDPRDDVLCERERDCRALIASDFTDKNPMFGKSFSGASFKEKDDESKKMLNRWKNLHLKCEDIEECSNFDKLLEIQKLSASIAKAHQFEHGRMSTNQVTAEEKAFEIFEAAAKKGSAEGLYNMARFYSEGKAGLPRNFDKAIKLSRKAASQKAFIRVKEMMIPNIGVAEAESILGNCYRDGRGVDQCDTEAFKWYLKASRHDCPTAQNNLGLALLNGVGCKKNETSARNWFQKAAERGLAEAQHNYAMVLEEGRGGPIDVKKAGELLQLSADQGTPGALERLQKLSRSGALGASNMDRTKENLRKAAKKGDPASLSLLGLNYLNGTGGFDKDLQQAERNLKAASQAGYPDAHLPLGKLLLELKKNEEAVNFIKFSAEKGSAEGQFELGILFAYGHGCARDEAKARRWLNRAKKQGITLKLKLDDEEKTNTDDWVEKQIDFGRKLVEFEAKQQLKPEGLTVQERKRRFISSKLDANNPSTSTALEFIEMMSQANRTQPSPKGQSMETLSPKFMNEMISRAENGSAIAQSFFKALEILERAMDLLMQQQTNETFKLFRLSQRVWDLPIMEYSFFYSECIEAAKQALDLNSQDADALYVIARIDMTQSNEEKLQMAKRCVELNPSVPDFHHLLGCMWGFVNNHKNGLRAVDQAIEMLPEQTDWLYDRATLIRMKEDDAAEAYLKFISLNPTDHRKFPEACYCLAQIYVLSGEKTKAEMYYKKGLETEDSRIRLPCFKPVEDKFPAKMITRMLLKASEGMNMSLKKTAATPAVAQKETTNHCANCFKSDQSSRCNSCKSVWYCGRDCQKTHWKKHKEDCKRLSCQS